MSNLRWTGHLWSEVLFLGRLLGEYEQHCAVSRDMVSAHSLDDVGRRPDVASAGATLRWMLLHVVEETARHVGSPPPRPRTARRR